MKPVYRGEPEYISIKFIDDSTPRCIEMFNRIRALEVDLGRKLTEEEFASAVDAYLGTPPGPSGIIDP